MLKKSRADAPEVASPTAARWFAKDTMVQYWQTGLQVGSEDKHGAQTFDGMRKGGQKIVFFAYWSHKTFLALWSPPQVGFSK